MSSTLAIGARGTLLGKRAAVALMFAKSPYRCLYGLNCEACSWRVIGYIADSRD